MDTINFVVFVIGLIALFGGVLIWAFGRKRKKRFEEDGRVPFGSRHESAGLTAWVGPPSVSPALEPARSANHIGCMV